jgi:hypothetical protein
MWQLIKETKMSEKEYNIEHFHEMFKWRSDLKYLPSSMRTFDKFSKVFYFLHECIGAPDENLFYKHLNYRQGTIYVVDMFLWTMAKYGYTLQRSRIRGCDFADITESMEKLYSARRTEHYESILTDIINYKGSRKLNESRTGDNPKNLPDFLKDFHDQKYVFKFIHTIIDRENDKDHILEQVSYADAQIYTIDYFLFIMFKYGYTLQKSRAKLNFYDLKKDIEKMKNKESENFI